MTDEKLPHHSNDLVQNPSDTGHELAGLRILAKIIARNLLTGRSSHGYKNNTKGKNQQPMVDR